MSMAPMSRSHSPRASCTLGRTRRVRTFSTQFKASRVLYPTALPSPACPCLSPPPSLHVLIHTLHVCICASLPPSVHVFVSYPLACHTLSPSISSSLSLSPSISSSLPVSPLLDVCIRACFRSLSLSLSLSHTKHARTRVRAHTHTHRCTSSCSRASWTASRGEAWHGTAAGRCRCK